MTSKVRSITPIFNTSCGNPKMYIWCKCGDCSSNPLQVIARTSRIPKSKWPWRSRSMTSIFNTSCEYPRMHIWCQFDDSSSISDKLSCRQCKVYGRTGWQTGTTTIPLRLERPKCKKWEKCFKKLKRCDLLQHKQHVCSLSEQITLYYRIPSTLAKNHRGWCNLRPPLSDRTVTSQLEVNSVLTMLANELNSPYI